MSEQNSSSPPPPTIDLLLNLVPDHPATVLQHLHLHPSLASQQDTHGYSLLHAAASYNHPELARKLVKDFNVDPNLLDEDEETPLFSVETRSMAELLLRELGTDPERKNAEGMTAGEKFEAEDEWPEVIEFLRGGDGPAAAQNGGGVVAAASSGSADGDGEIRHPPPLPQGIQINVGTMSDAEVGGEPDPEFRRRIEELAARGDFEGEEGQRELRRLVEEVVGGMGDGGEGQGPAAARRRLG